MEKLGSPEPAQPLQGAEPDSLAKAAGVVGDEATGAARSKLSQCACMRRWLPLAYREELYQVLRLTGPLVLSRILNFLLPFVVTIFCGHIGNAELAGYALASATINVSTTATGYGLALACDTLISQTFGSKNLKRVGVILQRSSLILLLVCLPCWALLINSQNLLLIMLQDSEVARIAQLYVMAFLPAVPAMFLHQLQVAYLQNQGIILPQMYTAAAANIINLGVNYGLIVSLQLGVIGSAIASSLSQITICLLLFIYIKWKKLHQQTWDGWSIDCLQEWGSYMKLAVPSLFMVWFEWWIWEIGSFLAGTLGEDDLAAQHILVEIGSIGYMFPLGIQAAACVRVGNALGAGNTKSALITCKVTLVLAGLWAGIQAIVITSFRLLFGRIFTTDKNILGIVAENLKVFIFLQFFDALLCVSSGILIGAGMQKIAALSNLMCYYCFSLPVGMALMFKAKLRILGFWLGIFICVVFETGFFIGLIFKLNWKKITEKRESKKEKSQIQAKASDYSDAILHGRSDSLDPNCQGLQGSEAPTELLMCIVAQRRARKKSLMTPNRPTSALVSEAMLPDVPDDPAQLSSEGASTADGYSPVDAQNKELKDAHEVEVSNANAGGRDGVAGQNTNASNKKPEVPLSTTQLILHRGLALLISALVLAIGVIFHIAFPPPEPRSNFNLTWANDSTPTMLAPLNMTSTV